MTSLDIMVTGPQDSDEIRRYLLGLTGEEESARFEERYLANDADFELANAIEDELFFEYAAGEMDPAERVSFEKRFLADRAGRERLRFARTLLERTSEMRSEVPARASTGLMSYFAGVFDLRRALHLGAVAAVIVAVVIAAGLLIRNARNNAELARQQAEKEQVERERDIAADRAEQQRIQQQIEAEKNKPQPDQKRAEELEKQSKEIDRDMERHRERLQSPSPVTPGGRQTIATAILSPGLLSRGSEGADERIKLGTATTATLVLVLKDVEEHAGYSAVVKTIDDDALVTSRSGIRPSGKLRKAIRLSIPAAKLKRADYQIELHAAETDEVLARYYFSVDK